VVVIGVLVGTFGALIGFAALIDRRRYRGVPVPANLTGRERRDAIRAGRAELAHLHMISGSGHLGHASGSDGGSGGHGGGDGGCAGDGGSC